MSSDDVRAGDTSGEAHGDLPELTPSIPDDDDDTITVHGSDQDDDAEAVRSYAVRNVLIIAKNSSLCT